MYGAVRGFLIVLSALGIWYLLKRTKLSLPVRVVLAVMLTVLAAVVLVWASVCASTPACSSRNARLSA